MSGDFCVKCDNALSVYCGPCIDKLYERLAAAEEAVAKLGAQLDQAERDAEQALFERDNAREQSIMLRSALSSIVDQYHWDDSPAGNVAREALRKVAAT